MTTRARSSAPRTSTPGGDEGLGRRRARQHTRRPLHPSRCASSTPGRRCHSSAPSRPHCRRALKGFDSSPARARTTSSEYRPNGGVVIRRNRYYGGNREHHVDGFDVELSSRLAGRDDQPGRHAGSADWTYTLPAIALGPSPPSDQKYSAQPRAVLARAGLTVSMLSSTPPARSSATTRSYGRRSTSPSTGMRSHARSASATRPTIPADGVAGLTRSERSTRSKATRPARRSWRRETSATERPSSSFPTSRRRATRAAGRSNSWLKIGLDVEIQPFGEHATASSYLGRLGSGRAVGPGARALDARLRRSLRVHQPAASTAARRRPTLDPLRRAPVHRPDAEGGAPAGRGAQRRPTPSSTCSSPATPPRSSPIVAINEVDARLGPSRPHAARGRGSS